MIKNDLVFKPIVHCVKCGKAYRGSILSWYCPECGVIELWNIKNERGEKRAGNDERICSFRRRD